MQTEIIIAGFGGQGILFAGTILAQAAMNEGRNVTWIPSYGPEMRGGTAHVTVVISHEEIGSPIVRCPDTVLALNNPSLEKYNSLIKSGGLLVYNSSLAVISPEPQRVDIDYVSVPATDLAAKAGDIKLANMVGLGALLAAARILPHQAVHQTLSDYLSGDKRKLLEPNRQAFEYGARQVEPVQDKRSCLERS